MVSARLPSSRANIAGLPDCLAELHRVRLADRRIRLRVHLEPRLHDHRHDPLRLDRALHLQRRLRLPQRGQRQRVLQRPAALALALDPSRPPAVAPDARRHPRSAPDRPRGGPPAVPHARGAVRRAPDGGAAVRDAARRARAYDVALLWGPLARVLLLLAQPVLAVARPFSGWRRFRLWGEEGDGDGRGETVGRLGPGEHALRQLDRALPVAEVRFVSSLDV